MNNSIIGNYLCEAVSEDGFFLMHFDRKDYITDNEGNKIIFTKVDKFSSISGTFAAECAEGGLLLIDDNGISIDFVFEDIGYEAGNSKFYRPVKYSGGEKHYWTYCVRSEDDGTKLLEYDLDISISEDEDVRLGEKLGNGKYFCVEHYPHQGIPYKTIGYLNSEITTNKFSSLMRVPCEKECIIGKGLNGRYYVYGPDSARCHQAVFSDAPVHSSDGIWWAGLYKDELLFYDLNTRRHFVGKRYKGGELKYRENLNILLEYDPSDRHSICNIWDLTWGKNILDGSQLDSFQQINTGENPPNHLQGGFNTPNELFRVIDRVGRSHDMSLVEMIKVFRDAMDNIARKNIEIDYHYHRMRNAVNEELKRLGFNALRNFSKTTAFADWTVYYYRTQKATFMRFDMKVILLPVSMVKAEASAVILVASEQDSKLYVCNRLKTRLDEQASYLSVLFELTDFPENIFKDVPSGSKMKVADLINEGKNTLPDKLIGKKKTPKQEETKPDILFPLIQQLRQHDYGKNFPSTEVEFDDIKYTLTPYQPWDIAVDPFYKNSFLPKSSGVFVLLNDSFVNEPMRAMATTEGAFSSIPDYMMEGVGQDGQYISNGNANGHIILKRKNVYLFYRDMKGKLWFFDSATYWGHSEQGVSTRPVLHIYLRSLLRKNGVK